MDPITQQTALACAGAGGAGEATYVDDVFSTFLYEGNSTNRSINNGIDLSGEGGLTWIKSRTNTYPNLLFDTERGAGEYLISNTNEPESTNITRLSAFNSDGFSLGTNSNVNLNGQDFVSWTFRKAPGFFDVVTWTGNSVSGRQIAHNLGSVPGFIMIKSYVAGTGGTGWMCYHRSLGNTKAIRLDNGTAATSASSTYWNNTDPTSTHFTVGNQEDINTSANSRSYVAYVFAHDEPVFGTNEDESIIKCGSYTGTNANGNFVNLGFEPQWVLTKNTSRAANWTIWDNMRGVNTGSTNDRGLHPNTTDAESGAGNLIDFNATGFTLNSGSDLTNWLSGDTFIYIAIRRPHKPPTAGTDVFHVATAANDSTFITSGFPIDFGWQHTTADTWGHYSFSRLQGSGTHLLLSSNSAEVSFGAGPDFDSNTQYQGTRGLGTNPMVLYAFGRAPGFFDVVAYTGNDVATNKNHNLGVPPELIITKATSGPFSRDWYVGPFVSGYSDSDGYLVLNSDAAGFGNVSTYFPGTPTSTIYGLPGGGNSGTNGSAYTYVSYLFATLAGISKVGTYSGTGSDVNVDCGFSAGARFILIKRTDSTGDWYTYDSARGITSGNDPYYTLNASGADVTNTDYIDPLNSGFTVTSSAPANLNSSGGTYIFLAIA